MSLYDTIIPAAAAPVQDLTGVTDPVWYRFFAALWNRTGGAKNAAVQGRNQFAAPPMLLGGSQSNNTLSSGSITFSAPFPNAVVSIVTSAISNPGNPAQPIAIGSVTTAGFSWAAPGPVPFYWLAYGY